MSTVFERGVRRCALLLAVALACVAGGAAWAAEMRWGSKKIVFAAVEPKDLRVFLREFAAQQGVGVFIDPEVKGELTSRYELPPRSMMELLARTFGLVWYFDGRVLYIYPATAMESGVIRLGDTTPAQFDRALDLLGISDSRFPLSYDGARRTALVSGPRRFVQLVKEAASAAEQPREVTDPTTEVRVYGLKYGFAEDYQVNSGGREYRVHGVVTILRQAYGGEGRGAGANVSRQASLVQRKPLDNASVRGAGPVLPELQGRREERRALEEPTETQRVVSTAQGVPSFAADPRTNAVIVRDIRSRIDQYEAIIRRLDERPRLVEIEANIVEVNSDDFSALGIDWRVAGRRGQLEIGGGGIANSVVRPPGVAPAPVGATPLQSLGTIAGTVLGVVAGNRTQLFARISALEQDGKASMRAQPKVMTLNNVEAALDAMTTFYVPVQGFQDAQLFEIFAGTSIRITPSVVSEASPSSGDGNDLVRLLIRIEDGGLTDQIVGDIPVVQRTTINTQSIVGQGQTLLIAGYSQERVASNKSGVPVLGRVPMVGSLFRSEEKNRTRVERLFMITPRLVDLPVAELAAPVSVLPETLTR